MSRVAYIVSTLKRCGPSCQLLYIVRNLDRSLFDPLVITLSPESNDSMEVRYSDAGIRVISLNLSRAQGFFLAKPILEKRLDREGVSLLHTQGIRADSLAASFQHKWKSVCSVRNFPQLDYPMTYGALRGTWMARTHTNAMKKIAAPCGVSSAVCRNLKEVFNVQARAVCNGVDTKYWTPVGLGRKRALRKELGLPSDKTIWVSVGHLSERKDPLTVVHGMKLGSTENAALVFLGSGPLDDAARKAADGCERIHFRGRVENVRDYLQAADGFVSASHAEGFPNAALEAMACGLPCLLSDIGPHRELADHANRSVVLFKENSAKDLCDQMIAFSLDKAAGEARVLIKKNFSAEGMSEKYQRIYQELLNG